MIHCLCDLYGCEFDYLLAKSDDFVLKIYPKKGDLKASALINRIYKNTVNLKKRFPDYDFSNLTLIYYPMSSRGFCFKKSGVNIIALNSNMSKGQLNFYFACELYHLKNTMKTYILSDSDDNEIEGDTFAYNFLIPSNMFYYYKNFFEIFSWDLDNLVKLQNFFKINHETSLEYLFLKNEITHAQKKDFLNVNIIKEVKKRGYPTDLYLPPDYDKMLFGGYVNGILKLNSDNLISDGVKNKLLLDGYRWDLVFKC